MQNRTPQESTEGCFGNYDLSESPCKICPIQTLCGTKTYDDLQKIPLKEGLILDIHLNNTENADEFMGLIPLTDIPEDLSTMFQKLYEHE